MATIPRSLTKTFPFPGANHPHTGTKHHGDPKTRRNVSNKVHGFATSFGIDVFHNLAVPIVKTLECCIAWDSHQGGGALWYQFRQCLPIQSSHCSANSHSIRRRTTNPYLQLLLAMPEVPATTRTHPFPTGREPSRNPL